MMTSPIVYGIDPYKRRFFSLRYMNRKELGVVTFFQRYTDSPFSWRGCGHFNTQSVFDSSYGSGTFNYDLLKNLVDGKEITIEVCGSSRTVKLC